MNNDNKKKKKIWLVPHTHWDREWYFTYDTGNVLFNHAFNDVWLSNHSKWMLDGQWSLIDDFIRWNPSKKNKIKKILKNQIACGPLYTQPDVFNSQAETIFRNFEIGKKVGDDLEFKQLDTAYFPDTFGFSENMPQIFKLSGMKNFVFWRGAKQETLNKDLNFIWEGIDNTKIKSYCLIKGYFSLGMYYPYNDGNVYPEKLDYNKFLQILNDRVNDTKEEKSEYIFGLGGDQAPFIKNQINFVNNLNKNSDKYNIQLTNNFDHYFNNQKPKNTYKGSLRTPYAGKIHRTITSSRYDIKKAFRTAEDRLYYLLEPLEYIYSLKDKAYDFEEYKTENIVKPLLLAQAHDSLGGCNTDQVNRMQLNRLERITENIDSQIDLIMKKHIQHNKIEDDKLVIFNPSPLNSSLNETKIIYSSKYDKINYKDNEIAVITIDSKEISLNPKKPLYQITVIINATNLKPLSFKTFNIENNTSFKQKETDFNINEIKLNGKKYKLELTAIEDKGDSYDFSPGKAQNVNVSITKKSMIETDFVSNYILSGKINKSSFEMIIFKSDNKMETRLMIDNKMKDTKLSLEITSKSNEIIQKSKNLAIHDFRSEKIDEDWNQALNEYPANVEANDGIVSLNELNILTKGNNEIFRLDNGVKLTLFRSYSYVTKNNMKWRPTTSGLSWKKESPDANLNKILSFDFCFTTDDRVQELNHFKFKPYSYYNQNRNFIANKMTKFVINNIYKEIDCKNGLEIITKNVFISSFRRLGNMLFIRVANMEDKRKNFAYKYNGKKIIEKIDKYQIKSLKIKI